MGPEIRPERIAGADDERWASWLVEKKEDWDKIENPQLKLEIRLLARRGDNTVTEDVLLKAHDRIEDWVRQGTVSIEEAALWLPYIEKRHLELSQAAPEGAKEGLGALERTARATEEMSRRIAGGEVTEELPDDEEKQRELIIGLVEHVETSDLPIAPTGLSQQLVEQRLMNRIEGLLVNENCIESVKKEAVARLRLQHCYAIASAIPGNSKLASEFLLGAFLQPESRRWALEGEDFNLFLKEGIKGLHVAKAFMLLQAAYTKGRDGKTLGDKNISLGEREAVLKGIEGDLGGGRSGRRSLKLAQRIARATLETSVWNTELAGNDPLAEAIYFRQYRARRRETGRDRGPDITINTIFGFGSSFFRGAKILKENKEGEQKGDENGESTYLFLQDSAHNPADLTNIPSHAIRIRGTLERIRGQKISEKERFESGNFEKRENYKFEEKCLLKVGDYNYDRLKPGEYSGWLGISIPRILATKSLLLQTAWKPGDDFNSDAIEGYVAPFNSADPKEVIRLKPEFILGVLWSAYSRPNEAANLGWDAVSLNQIKGNLTTLIKAEEREFPAFISKEQLKWVITELRQAGINIEHEAAMVNVRKSVRRTIIGG